MFGDKLYQIRARSALPILVRQAASQNPIFYEALAIELDMPNPRNLNYVLGSIGTTLNELSVKSGWSKIPHIQSLVINKTHQLPGPGFDQLLARTVKNYRNFSLSDKRRYLKGYWQEIYAYTRWEDVLDACKPNLAESNSSILIENAKHGKSDGGGEGEEHRKLKEYIANNPSAIGLPANAIATIEAPLPSGDKIDILFSERGRLTAVEVKSRISNDIDLTRGLFQCVKYRAVLEAERGFKSARYEIDIFLVLGLKFPEKLYALRNSLGVNVQEIRRKT
jgi:CRISPR/Cas system-associated exonuclease Cas4 (RecB family)